MYIYIYVYTYVNWGMLSYQPAIPRGGGGILSTHPHAIGGPPRMVPYGAAYGVQRYRTVPYGTVLWRTVPYGTARYEYMEHVARDMGPQCHKHHVQPHVFFRMRHHCTNPTVSKRASMLDPKAPI